MSTQRYAQFKLVLLGESAVGKSSVVHRFVKNTFDNMRESTIGAAFLTQSVTLPDIDATVKFEIWDTAGQERYKSLAPMYYRNAHAALCVYDITNNASFQKAQNWIKELKKQAPEGIVICLVGNKGDLEEDRQVDAAAVKLYVAELNRENTKVFAAECSAKSGAGVVDIFTNVAKELPVEETINGASKPSGRQPGVELNRRPQQLGCC